MPLIAELIAALGLLTRLPVGQPNAPLAASIWAFPLVGALSGALGGAVYFACAWIGMQRSLAAAWALAAMMLVTGAFHEDGLADTADGFGGSRDRARKLEIMRDSRIGTFGAIALILSLAIRWAAITVLVNPTAVLIAAGALSRAAIVVTLVTLNPARSDGLAASLGAISLARAGVAVLIAVLLAFLAMPAGAALRLVVCAGGASLLISWLAWRQIGGYTGDILGATAVVTECVVLSVAALARSPN